jgi:hypothetical protein
MILQHFSRRAQQMPSYGKPLDRPHLYTNKNRKFILCWRICWLRSPISFIWSMAISGYTPKIWPEIWYVYVPPV